MITIRKMVKMMLVVSMVALFGCGGGGGGGSAPPPGPTAPGKATTTVSGKVDFPSLSSLVAKRVNLGEAINVNAYTIDGVLVGSAVADATGSFTISGLDSGVDYVLKATRGSQVLKKLIEKATVAPGATVPNQDLSGVSTTAVVVASQKLAPVGVTNFNLGEPITLSESQKATMSENIFTTVSPKDLETAIISAQNTVQAAITAVAANPAAPDIQNLTKELAYLVNTLNIIVAAVSSNVDPTKVISGEVANFTVATDISTNKKLQILDVSNTGSVSLPPAPTTSLSSTEVKATVTSSVTAYTAPSRVNLDVSSNAVAGTLYGITFEITVPVDATVKLDTNGKPAFSLVAGVTSSCFAAASLTGNILKVVIADVSPLPSGKLVSFVFDKTPVVVLTDASFPLAILKTSDNNGGSLQSSFSLTSVVTSSGS